MIATENLTNTMQWFGKLTEAERLLFLQVVAPKTVEVKKPEKKRKKSKLPAQFSEESFYKDLVATHNQKVAKRLQNRKKRNCV